MRQDRPFPNDLAQYDEFVIQGLISPEEMRRVDCNAQALGISGLELMESAGTGLSMVARKYQKDRILILCGSGNNGGDGMVAARHLSGEADVMVLWYNSGRQTEGTKTQLHRLAGCKVCTIPFRCRDDLNHNKEIFQNTDLIIDALLGTGGAGPAREPLQTCIELANNSSAPVLSADLPSPGIRPDKVCAFHRAKTDEAITCGIGIPLLAEIGTGPGDLLILQERSPSSHKGVGGNILVIGGGPYQGAPYLAGLAALRAGADIVRVISPCCLPEPDLIHVPVTGDKITCEDLEIIIPLCEQADVVLCGPGLGSESHEVITEIAPYIKKGVFDADALRKPLPVAIESLYTPHAGEFARISGKDAGGTPAEQARAIKSSGISGTVLLKGRVDIISDGTRVRFNQTGTSAMTTGGTGDVLAGICTALMVTNPAFEAACTGAWVTGRAGELVTRTYGYGMTASDLLSAVPQVLFRKTPERE